MSWEDIKVDLVIREAPFACPEVVGSNPAPATKNLQLVGIADELFSYLGAVLSARFSTFRSKISICNR